MFNQPQGNESGYPLLAYNPLNYGAACLTCNRVRKKNYFPIAGTRDFTSTDPAAMTGERPYLLYPISDLDDDPEDLIAFAGITAQAKGRGFHLHRALVMIWVFQLNRAWLQKDRAAKIVALYLALEMSQRMPRNSVVRDAVKVACYMTSSAAPYANCLRSFRRLYEADQPAAERIYRKCARLVTKGSR